MAHANETTAPPDTQAALPGNVHAAIREWTEALGDARIASDAKTIGLYARTTQAEAPAPCCILYPRSTEAVRTIVEIARRHAIPVYPISRGKNWGYGDACAPTPNAAIIDLSQMNRILDVNTDLAYCVIEPGVSQRELYDHLQDNNTGLWMDATAAGPDSSLVGNTVDRGFGHTRYGDHFLTCCGMEIVLADGRVLNTGFGHFDNARATNVYPYGVGPYIDGLFCQSNYGIVTKIGLWLLPEPEDFNFFYFQVPNFEDIGSAVERLRPLRMSGILQTAIHIGNDFRVLAGSSAYPWDLTKGEAPLPPDVRQRIRAERGAQAWQGSGSISGTRDHVRASRKALRRAMNGLATVKFVTDRKLALAERATAIANRFGLAKEFAHKLKILRPNYELLKGIPTSEPLLGAQWRLRNRPDGPVDPLTPGCGLYWISPVMPMTAEDAHRVLGIAEPVFKAHGFDMIITFVLLTERSLVAIINIAFDKSVEGEPQKASDCYEALVDGFHAGGYYIYRAGLQGVPKLHQHGDVFWEVARQIKQTLDPEDIIARGRYIPPLEGPTPQSTD